MPRLIRLRWRQLLRLTLLCTSLLLIRYLYSPPPLSTMPPKQAPHEVASSLLATQGLHLRSLEVIQSLWAGYGSICRITASPSSPISSTTSSRTTSTTTSSVSTPQEVQSYILKLITPPPTKPNDEGHTRKILSYQVEQYFYTALAPQLPPYIPVAKHLASIHEPREDGNVAMAMILSDLAQTHPVAGESRSELSPTQIDAALAWLASFHGFWWSRVSVLDRKPLLRPPLEEVTTDGQDARNKTVWLNGGYTYLATRLTEYHALAASPTSEWHLLTTPLHSGLSLADLAAHALAPGSGPNDAYTTLIHGDVKTENLFTSRAGDEVVFYDFQYTGLGLGVCDLAKLFTCSVPLSLLLSSPPHTHSLPSELAMQHGEKKLLERYWQRLREEARREYAWDVFVRHWETALVDWLRFQASWGFWGNTEWLEARVRFILRDGGWESAVVDGARRTGFFGE